MIQNNINNVRDREAYNMKKIKKFNSIDQTHNTEDLKNLILKPIKIEKANIDIKALANSREHTNLSELKQSEQKRVNNPYKGIIKDFNYDQKLKKQDDLVIHKVTDQDKDKKQFDEKMDVFKDKITNQNTEIKDIYSIDKKTQHKKDFEYQHKYKYRTKLEAGNEESDLRVDRIEFYKKEQQKLEHNKKKIDNILLDLIDSGILSDNLDSINFDKIDADKLAETLKNTFGEEEYKKLMKELS
jgi:hypothetical protein